MQLFQLYLELMVYRVNSNCSYFIHSTIQLDFLKHSVVISSVLIPVHIFQDQYNQQEIRQIFSVLILKVETKKIWRRNERQSENQYLKRQVLFIVRVEVAKTPKIQQFALYQTDTSRQEL